MAKEFVHESITEEEVSSMVDKYRRQIITTMANSMGQFNADSLTAFLVAVSNFETTALTASKSEARPDIVGVVASTAFKEGFKAASIAAMGSAALAAGAALSLVVNLKQEVDRAAAAATMHSMGEWVKAIRTGAVDAYQKFGNTRQILSNFMAAFDQVGSEDERQSLVDGAASIATAIDEGIWPLASVSQFERALYEAWINSHFSFIGRVDDDISGFIDARFAEDGQLSSLTVVAPIGARIGDALNNVASAAGARSMMDLAVHKRVCRWAENAAGGSGWSCGWFDATNNFINKPNSEDVTQFLKRDDWRQTLTLFRS